MIQLRRFKEKFLFDLLCHSFENSVRYHIRTFNIRILKALEVIKLINLYNKLI